MNFIVFQVDDVEVVFPHFLKTTQIFVADRVPFMKRGTFEFSGTNFGHIMCQLFPHRVI